MSRLPDVLLAGEHYPVRAMPIIRLTYRDGKGAFHADWPASHIQESHRATRAGLLWVDIHGPDEPVDRKLEDWLCDVFHFHPLAIEDALQGNPHPQGGRLGRLSLHRVSRGQDRTRFGRSSSSTSWISSWAGIIWSPTIPRPCRSSIKTASTSNTTRAIGCGTAPIICSTTFSSWRSTSRSTAIEQLDEQVDAIQNAVIENASPKSLKTIFRIKRSAIRLHKTLSPQREVLNRLARDPYQAVQAKHRVYFRDLYDHVVRIHDISESLRDLIAGALETYLSVVSNRTNDIMKTLTIVTVMFMPMSFLVGFFGMNFFGEAARIHEAACRRACSSGGRTRSWRYHPCFIWIYAAPKEWF